MRKTSSKKASRRTRAVKRINENDPHFIAARFLRNNRKHKLPIDEGILARKRVDVFKGSDFLEAIQNVVIPKAEHLQQQATTIKRAEAIGNKMMSMGLFHQATPKEDKYFENALDFGKRPHKMNEDGLYVWLIPASMTHIYIYSALLVVFALFLCLIKVWPLWMKIAVWWLSLILLVSISFIIALRLVLYMLFWIAGVRDIWLLPDFLDDSVGPLEALTPLFGRGHVKETKLRKKALKAGKEYVEPAVSFSFGMANLAGMLVVGLVLCWYGGFFKGENIPDFLAGREEIFENYAFLLDEKAFVPDESTLQEDVVEEPAEAEMEVDMDALIDDELQLDLDMDAEEADLLQDL